jgi:anti-sigma factor RsiW
VTNQQMGEACRGWRGDLAACLVGAVDPQASAAARRHLGTCPACQAEHEDLAMVVACLALFSHAPRPYPTTCSDRW